MFSVEKPNSFYLEQKGEGFYKVIFTADVMETTTGYYCKEYPIVIEAESITAATEKVEQNFDAYFEWGKSNYEEANKAAKVSIYKNQLNASDYQVIKCAESFMLGNVLPYNFSELLYKRNSTREAINAAEEEYILESEKLENLKNLKIMEMSAQSQYMIKNGIDYNNEHYSLNTHDQINLTSLYALAQAGQSVPYHADGQVCRIYSAEEMVGLVQASIQWIIYHTTYFNLLKHLILDQDDAEVIEAVEYGMVLTEEYQTILDSILG